MVLLFVTDSLYHKRHITVTTFGYVPSCFLGAVFSQPHFFIRSSALSVFHVRRRLSANNDCTRKVLNENSSRCAISPAVIPGAPSKTPGQREFLFRLFIIFRIF